MTFKQKKKHRTKNSDDIKNELEDLFYEGLSLEDVAQKTGYKLETIMFHRLQWLETRIILLEFEVRQNHSATASDSAFNNIMKIMESNNALVDKLLK